MNNDVDFAWKQIEKFVDSVQPAGPWVLKRNGDRHGYASGTVVLPPKGEPKGDIFWLLPRPFSAESQSTRVVVGDERVFYRLSYRQAVLFPSISRGSKDKEPYIEVSTSTYDCHSIDAVKLLVSSITCCKGWSTIREIRSN